MTRWLLALLVVTTAACNAEPMGEEAGSARPATRVAEPEEALSDHLMIALGQAKNFHHKADVYLANGQTEPAITALRQILAIDFPEDAPEAEDVRADARARLGVLLLEEERLDEAMAVIDEGIESATRESFFVANLYTVRGEILEARAASLEESKPEAARAARLEAIEAIDRSIVINEALLRALPTEAPR